MFFASVVLREEFLDGLTATVASHHWKLLVNRTTVPFVTSDHPVGMRNHFDESLPALNLSGLGAEGIEVTLPLAPDVTLVMGHQQMFARPGWKDGFMEPASDGNVVYYNTLQGGNSHSFVYGDPAALQRVEEFLGRKPHLRVPGGGLDERVYRGSEPMELPENAKEMRLALARHNSEGKKGSS